MTATYYVIFNKHGIDRFIKTDRCQLKQGEFYQRVDFVVDDALFKPVTVPTVKLCVNSAGVARIIDASIDDIEASDEQDES